MAKVEVVSLRVKLPAFAGSAYIAQADGAPLEPGSVGGDGMLSLSVPARSRTVRVTFASPAASVDLQVGHLDPIDTPSGRRQRLNNLGIPVPDARDEKDGHALRRATALFQLARGLPPTGDFDPSTQSALEEAHGS